MLDLTAAPAVDRRTASPRESGLHRLTDQASARIDPLLVPLSRLLARAAVPALRITLGLVFLGFGVLKFFPGMSPAEEIVQRTLDVLSFGLVGPTAAVLMTAVLESFIGLTLITGRFLRIGLLVLAGALVGIMSPLVLFFGDLFPAGGPTLLAQYVLKDVVLAAAGLAVAAWALGARFQVPGR